MCEPFVEVALEGLDAFIEGFTHFDAEELVQDRAVKSLDKAISFWRFHLGSPMFDPVEVEIEFIGVCFGAAEFPAIIRQDRLHRQIKPLIEGQHVIVQDRNRGFRPLGDMQKAKGIGAIGIDNRMQVDLADALQVSHEESVG